MAQTVRHLGQVRTSQVYLESRQEMSLAHWEYNSQKPVTHAGPPRNDFLFKGVRVGYRCFHFLFFHSRQGCQAQRLSVAYPALEPMLGPCYCAESVSDEARQELLRIGALNGFDLAEGNTQASVYLGKGPDMRLSLPHFNRNRPSLGRFAEK
jgi:hypothetical protein